MTDRRVIRQALTKLSPPQRALIHQAYYLKRTTAQIAIEFDISEHVVRCALHDAMQELRRILAEVNVYV